MSKAITLLLTVEIKNQLDNNKGEYIFKGGNSVKIILPPF